MSFRSALKIGVAAAGAALIPVIGQAQSAAPAGDRWQTALSIYGFFPSMGGTTSFPTLPGTPSPGISVDASTIL